jgi:DNA-binding NarL/FixJ family response regulator
MDREKKTTNTIRVVVADDHPLILDALDNLFHLEEDIQVVARCKDGAETMSAVRQHQPDVLILDIRMPGKDGLQVLWEMRSEKLSTRVVLLTAEIDDSQLVDAVRMGVRGVVLKEMAPKLLVTCVRKVHNGELWIERRLERQALEKVLYREADSRKAGSVLTASEMNVVRLAVSGLRNKDIADKLYISEGTVKVHLHNIYEKLKIDGRIALVRYAQEKDLM